MHTKVAKYMYQFLKENICATICFFPLFFHASFWKQINKLKKIGKKC